MFEYLAAEEEGHRRINVVVSIRPDKTVTFLQIHCWITIVLPFLVKCVAHVFIYLLVERRWRLTHKWGGPSCEIIVLREYSLHCWSIWHHSLVLLPPPVWCWAEMPPLLKGGTSSRHSFLSDAAITQTCQRQDDFRRKGFFNLVQVFSRASGLYHVTSIISGWTRKISREGRWAEPAIKLERRGTSALPKPQVWFTEQGRSLA